MLRYRVIKQELLNIIKKCKPLEKLPSRVTLCLRLDTSRATLDKAIKELEAEGILFCKDGSGTYVAVPHGYDVRSSGNWGVLVPDICMEVYGSLVRGVEAVAQQQDINLIVCNFDNSIEKYEKQIQRLMLTDVSGLIIVPVFCQDAAEVARVNELLCGCTKPLVVCNREVDGANIPVVMSNNFYGAYIATDHLIKKGYRRIAYMSNYNYRTSIERCNGYVGALQENDLPFDPNKIVMNSLGDGDDEGYAAAKRLLATKGGVDAVFCFGSLLKGVYRAAREYGYRIPEDLGIICYDNTEVSRELSPPVTTVEYRGYDVGYMAANLLLQRINKAAIPEFPYYLLKPQLIERESCTGPTDVREERK